jgi:hypothetical protein
MTCGAKCSAQGEYTSSSLGPAAAKAVSGAAACAAAHCLGGRCVTIDGTGAPLPSPACV